MQTAQSHAAKGHWPADQSQGEILLDFDERHRRRIRLTATSGEAVLLDLPRATAMADGDGLLTGDGHWFSIRAKPEPLLAVTAKSPHDLLKLAWHLGNRHTPAEVQDGRILIRRDHVLADMVRLLGGTAEEVEEPFQPEGGAYGGHSHAHAHDEDDGGHSHGHGHSHTQGHHHHHGHSHEHAHE